MWWAGLDVSPPWVETSSPVHHTMRRIDIKSADVEITMHLHAGVALRMTEVLIIPGDSSGSVVSFVSR